MSEQFQVGDVVRLKSGGPAMTVTTVGNNMADVMSVWCVWFDQKAAQQNGTFPVGAVEKDG